MATMSVECVKPVIFTEKYEILKCNKCGALFSGHVIWRKHFAHRCPRRYSCLVCDITFMSKDLLYAHLKTSGHFGALAYSKHIIPSERYQKLKHENNIDTHIPSSICFTDKSNASTDVITNAIIRFNNSKHNTKPSNHHMFGQESKYIFAKTQKEADNVKYNQMHVTQKQHVMENNCLNNQFFTQNCEGNSQYILESWKSFKSPNGISNDNQIINKNIGQLVRNKPSEGCVSKLNTTHVIELNNPDFPKQGCPNDAQNIGESVDIFAITRISNVQDHPQVSVADDVTNVKINNGIEEAGKKSIEYPIDSNSLFEATLNNSVSVPHELSVVTKSNEIINCGNDISLSSNLESNTKCQLKATVNNALQTIPLPLEAPNNLSSPTSIWKNSVKEVAENLIEKNPPDMNEISKDIEIHREISSEKDFFQQESEKSLVCFSIKESVPSRQTKMYLDLDGDCLIENESHEMQPKRSKLAEITKELQEEEILYQKAKYFDEENVMKRAQILASMNKMPSRQIKRCKANSIDDESERDSSASSSREDSDDINIGHECRRKIPLKKIKKDERTDKGIRSFKSDMEIEHKRDAKQLDSAETVSQKRKDNICHESIKEIILSKTSTETEKETDKDSEREHFPNLEKIEVKKIKENDDVQCVSLSQEISNNLSTTVEKSTIANQGDFDLEYYTKCLDFWADGVCRRYKDSSREKDEEDTTKVVQEDTTKVVQEDTTKIFKEDTTKGDKEDTTKEDKEDTVKEDKEDTVKEDKEDATNSDKEDTTISGEEDTTTEDKEDTTNSDKEDITNSDKEDTTNSDKVGSTGSLLNEKERENIFKKLMRLSTEQAKNVPQKTDSQKQKCSSTLMDRIQANEKIKKELEMPRLNQDILNEYDFSSSSTDSEMSDYTEENGGPQVQSLVNYSSSDSSSSRSQSTSGSDESESSNSRERGRSSSSSRSRTKYRNREEQIGSNWRRENYHSLSSTRRVNHSSRYEGKRQRSLSSSSEDFMTDALTSWYKSCPPRSRRRQRRYSHSKEFRYNTSRSSSRSSRSDTRWHINYGWQNSSRPRKRQRESNSHRHRRSSCASSRSSSRSSSGGRDHTRFKKENTIREQKSRSKEPMKKGHLVDLPVEKIARSDMYDSDEDVNTRTFKIIKSNILADNEQMIEMLSTQCRPEEIDMTINHCQMKVGSITKEMDPLDMLDSGKKVNPLEVLGPALQCKPIDEATQIITKEREKDYNGKAETDLKIQPKSGSKTSSTDSSSSTDSFSSTDSSSDEVTEKIIKPELRSQTYDETYKDEIRMNYTISSEEITQEISLERNNSVPSDTLMELDKTTGSGQRDAGSITPHNTEHCERSNTNDAVSQDDIDYNSEDIHSIDIDNNTKSEDHLNQKEIFSAHKEVLARPQDLEQTSQMESLYSLMDELPKINTTKSSKCQEEKDEVPKPIVSVNEQLWESPNNNEQTDETLLNECSNESHFNAQPCNTNVNETNKEQGNETWIQDESGPDEGGASVINQGNIVEVQDNEIDVNEQTYEPIVNEITKEASVSDQLHKINTSEKCEKHINNQLNESQTNIPLSEIQVKVESMENDPHIDLHHSHHENQLCDVNFLGEVAIKKEEFRDYYESLPAYDNIPIKVELCEENGFCEGQESSQSLYMPETNIGSSLESKYLPEGYKMDIDVGSTGPVQSDTKQMELQHHDMLSLARSRSEFTEKEIDTMMALVSLRGGRHVSQSDLFEFLSHDNETLPTQDVIYVPMSGQKDHDIESAPPEMEEVTLFNFDANRSQTIQHKTRNKTSDNDQGISNPNEFPVVECKESHPLCSSCCTATNYIELLQSQDTRNKCPRGPETTDKCQSGSETTDKCLSESETTDKCVSGSETRNKCPSGSETTDKCSSELETNKCSSGSETANKCSEIVESLSSKKEIKEKVKRDHLLSTNAGNDTDAPGRKEYMSRSPSLSSNSSYASEERPSATPLNKKNISNSDRTQSHKSRERSPQTTNTVPKSSRISKTGDPSDQTNVPMKRMGKNVIHYMAKKCPDCNSKIAFDEFSSVNVCTGDITMKCHSCLMYTTMLGVLFNATQPKPKDSKEKSLTSSDKDKEKQRKRLNAKDSKENSHDRKKVDDKRKVLEYRGRPKSKRKKEERDVDNGIPSKLTPKTTTNELDKPKNKSDIEKRKEGKPKESQTKTVKSSSTNENKRKLQVDSPVVSQKENAPKKSNIRQL